MDIKEKISDIVEQIKKNPNLKEDFEKEPVKVIEKLIGVDLPDDIVEKIINYEVNKSDDYVLGIVKDALDRVLNKKDVTLKLSTADYYTVLSRLKIKLQNMYMTMKVFFVLLQL